ncbi:MAG: hypothetical protein IRZ00_05810, partial [Gemmatimonadetes bacterium]|nr:hypothetical protein [Gemmatimonadota bacterium]
GPGGPGGPWGRDPGPGDVDRVDCALLAGVTERGSSFRVVVRPSREGVRSGAELLDGISRRLAAGTPVVVRGVDGLEVRLSGAARARLRLERCGG